MNHIQYYSNEIPKISKDQNENKSATLLFNDPCPTHPSIASSNNRISMSIKVCAALCNSSNYSSLCAIHQTIITMYSNTHCKYQDNVASIYHNRHLHSKFYVFGPLKEIEKDSSHFSDFQKYFYPIGEKWCQMVILRLAANPQKEGYVREKGGLHVHRRAMP